MNSEKWQAIKNLYQTLTELPTDARADYLSRNCPDEEVRTMVEQMLCNRSQIAGFLEQPVLGETKDDDDVTNAAGRKVGAYLLKSEIGRGGMGVVYLASREDDAFQKEVAIKLLWPGFPGDEKRFRRERQILAKLEHPSIARLLDGGVTAEGWQYIVMEYIEGWPITEYCNEKQLTIPERLKLFRQVCEVVHYAHQNLVIHRDLKPGNILVTKAGMVKLLDFGIAKLINPEDQNTFLYSLPGNWMMTPEYASPEQLTEGNVTTASDLYSLGIVLYELLAGKRPYHFRTRLPEEAARIISESSLEPPSKIAVSTSEDKLPREKLRSHLQGDLDNIVLMALRREPEKRYHSVAQLSDDITRHLQGQPVIARKPTLAYRTEKFIRRHKTGVIIATMIFLTLLAGLITFIIHNRNVEAEARYNQRLLYAAHIRQAGQDWADGNLLRVGELLDLHRPERNRDEDTWRGPEWYCLWNLLHQERTALTASAPVETLAFTQDSSKVLTGLRSGKIEMWDAHTGQSLGILGDHGEWIYSMGISLDGKKLATGGQYGHVKIWEIATKRLLQDIPAHGSSIVWAVALSPDGETLATGGEDNTLKLWKTTTGELLYSVSYPKWVRAIQFSPDGELLAVGTDDPLIKLWQVKSGKEVAQLEGNTMGLMALTFSSEGKLLASAGRDSISRVYDVAGKKLLSSFSGHTDRVNGVIFSPDGKTLATASTDHTVRLWEVATGRQINVIENEGELGTLAISPDGTTLAGACSVRRTTKLWEVDKISSSRLIPAGPGINCLAFSPDGSTLIAGEDRSLELWDWPTGRKIATYKDEIGGVRSVEFSPDGNVFAMAHSYRPYFETRVELRDAKTGQVIRRFNGHTKNVMCVTFSPDGKTLASSGDDQTIRLWDVATGAERALLKGHTSYLRKVDFSPDGKRLASGAWDNTVKIWDVATGKELMTLQGHTGAIQAVRFSPDGKTIASGSRDYTVKLWNAETGAEIHALRGHGEVVNSIVFSADGKRLISGGFDRTVRVWDVETGAELLTLKGHTARVWAVAYTPDRNTLVSGSEDKTIRIWAMASGQKRDTN